jgi:tetratricopeptide (TPR) repeat protein
MKGKLDQARTLLEETPAKTPDNAAAYYELARTQMHMALGNSRNLEQGFADAQKSIDQAVALDSRKLVYHKFAGHVAYFRAYLALQMGRPSLQQHFTEASGAFEAALNSKPTHPMEAFALEFNPSTNPRQVTNNKGRNSLSVPRPWTATSPRPPACRFLISS